MGEMVDYSLDLTMDSEEELHRYLSGDMPDSAAYDRGIIDELGYRPTSGAITKSCRYCGAKGLTWVDGGNGWRLADLDGRLHTCVHYK